jgi:hypothetical protein
VGRVPTASLPPPAVALLEGQLGLVTRKQLLAAGVPAGRIDWWLEHRVIEAVHPAVYRRTAAHVPAAARALTAEDVTTVGPIPTMRAARAVLDAAPDLGEPRTRRVVDDLRRSGALRLPDLAACADRLADHRGSGAVRRLLADGSLSQESPGERDLAALLRGFHPQPRWQVEDLVPGRRLDACWVEALYALEFDGRAHHVLPSDRDADGLRDLEVDAAHVLTHRITSGMLRAQGPLVLRRIRATYERRLVEVDALIRAGLLPPALVARIRTAA